MGTSSVLRDRVNGAGDTERTNAIVAAGLTVRRARFLVTVMSHSGVFVGCQYATFAGITCGQNIAESIAWYEKMLGFKGTVRPGQPGARQQVADLRRVNITIELFQVTDAAPLPESRKNPSEDFRTHGVKHFGFEVKNLPAVLAELKAKGVKMAFDLRVTPTEDFAFISDNAGNAIELIEHKTR